MPAPHTSPPSSPKPVPYFSAPALKGQLPGSSSALLVKYASTSWLKLRRGSHKAVRGGARLKPRIAWPAALLPQGQAPTATPTGRLIPGMRDSPHAPDRNQAAGHHAGAALQNPPAVASVGALAERKHGAEL